MDILVVQSLTSGVTSTTKASENKHVILDRLISKTNPFRSWEWWLRVLVKEGALLQLSPFIWNEKERLMDVTKNKFRIFCWIFALVLLTLDNIYLTLVICTTNYSLLSYDDVLKLYLHSFSRIGACVVTWCMVIKMKVAASLYNQIILLHRFNKRQIYWDENLNVKDGVISFLSLVSIGVIVQPPVGPLIQHLQERQSVRYWGAHYLPPEFYNSNGGIILFSIMELLLSYTSLVVTGFGTSLLLAYVSCTNFWIRYIRNQKDKRLGVVRKKISMYRSLQVLSKYHLDCCSHYMWPLTQYMLIIIHVLLNIIIIKCHGLLPLPLLITLIICNGIFIIFEKSTLKAAAEIYESSVIFRKELMTCGSKKLKIIAASMRPIRVQVGSCYHFQMSTFNTFFRSLVDYTINVLLTFF